MSKRAVQEVPWYIPYISRLQREIRSKDEALKKRNALIGNLRLAVRNEKKRASYSETAYRAEIKRNCNYQQKIDELEFKLQPFTEVRFPGDEEDEDGSGN